MNTLSGCYDTDNIVFSFLNFPCIVKLSHTNRYFRRRLLKMYKFDKLDKRKLPLFFQACEKGLLTLAEKLYLYEDITNIYTRYNGSFTWNCKYGRLKIAKWMYSLEPKKHVDIRAKHEEAFNWSCKFGRLKVAKWLYSLKVDEKRINIHSNSEEAFRWSCAHGHLEIAKWLYSLGDNEGETRVNIHDGYNDAFTLSCIYGHLEVAKWLYSLGNNEGETRIVIHAGDSEIFRKNHSRIANWIDDIYSAQRRL